MHPMTRASRGVPTSAPDTSRRSYRRASLAVFFVVALLALGACSRKSSGSTLGGTTGGSTPATDSNCCIGVDATFGRVGDSALVPAD